MALIDSRTSRVLLTVLVFALGLGFLYTARHTLVAFLFAIFFAYLVDPLVSKLENLVRGRGRAIAIIYEGGKLGQAACSECNMIRCIIYRGHGE